MKLISACFWISVIGEVTASYLPWTPPDAQTEGLVCPSHCFSSNITEHNCCFCESKSEWEISSPVPLVPLYVEYTDISGSTSMLLAKEHYKGSYENLTGVEHTYGRIKAMPVNLCEFDNLVKMNLSNNEIEEINDISCLSRIEVIDLRCNSIQIIRNETFRTLERLRLLNVSYNPLRTIDPNSFQRLDGGSIFLIDIRMGKLDSMDVTNFIFQKQFCEINFDGNPIESITNPTAFKIDKAKEYGLDGTISVKNCRLYQMMNFSDIGMDQPSEFYKYLKFSFDARDSNLACDCLLAPILTSELDRLQKFWVQMSEGYDNVTCMSPEKLKGVTAKYLVESGDLDGMICDEPVHCPKGCDCYSQPSQNHLVINCTDAGLQTLPETLPWGNRYTLLMEGNDINSLDERDYLKRVYMADFRNNPVKTLATDAVSTFPDDVQLIVDGDGLSNLPLSMSDKIPNNIVLGNVYIDCSCNNKWLQIWVYKRFTSTHSTHIFCQNFNRIKIDQLDQELLNCDPIDKLWQRLAVVVSVIISIVLGLAMIFLCFKPEIFLLYRHHILCRKHDFDNLYDVYICCDERKQLVRKWILDKLSPYLEDNGYQVFWPCRDESFGEFREQIREHAINNSRAYVVVVSNGAFNTVRAEEDSSYISADDFTIQMEFSKILDNFKSDSKKRIAVINFDNLKTSQADIRYIKAFLRTRESIDFTNRYDDILQTIQKKIGPPLAKVAMSTKIMPDVRPDFNQKRIYRVVENSCGLKNFNPYGLPIF